MTADQLAQLLDEIGKRIGPAGEYVFRIAVQRVVISGLVWIALGLLLLAVAIVPLWVARRYWRSATQDQRDELYGPANDAMWIAVFGCMPLVLGVATVFLNIIPVLTPEYTALQDILRTVTGK